MVIMKKAQVDIISAVIIIALAIGLTATAYSWGIPLIQKRQSESLANTVHNSFDQDKVNSLPSKIEFVAKSSGAEETFSLDVDGIWILYPASSTVLENNSIQFTFLSKTSKVVVGAWTPLTPGATCPPSNGTLGLDKSSVVCARADIMRDIYNITYRIYYRELYESSDLTKGYKINLIQDPRGSNSLTSTSKSIRISRGDVYTQIISGKTLIITNVTILL